MSAHACRCVLTSDGPAAPQAERRPAQDSALIEVALPTGGRDGAPAVVSAPRPSGVHLPPLDRLTVFCVLLV